MELTPVIKDSFLQFAGAVLQSRAIVDVRDLIKPSARQIFYCLYTDKFVHSRPFQKTLKAIGSCFRVYIHGDASAEGVIMRSGQPFSMRYPLMEIEGSYGTLLSSGSWAAPRYCSARLSELAEYLFKDLDKNTIEEWRDNYDNTEKYPSVLPSKGFFNIVNGGYGIGVGASSSIPQYNLKEVNEALIKLLWNPDIDFDEIYCPPDFATGAELLNNAEVKESHKHGNGSACKLRAIIEWDENDRCFIVKELPYMVYTETICGELEKLINEDINCGIERFNDLTGEKPLIKIYLTKHANPNRVIKSLYKNTSLQTHYSINFTMLENGRFPRVFSWREVLISYLTHQKTVYRRGFEYDLNKIEARLHIIDGLLKAISAIDEVITTIRQSPSVATANKSLQLLLSIDEIQAKAILDLKLSRLTKLDVNKIIEEQNELLNSANNIKAILADENLLNKEIEKDLREVMSKFGDERRTRVLNIEKEEDEPLEERKLSLAFTNYGSVIVSETSSLYVQRRGGRGKNFELEDGEYVVDNVIGKNTDTILFFSNKGNFYPLKMDEIDIGKKIYLHQFVDFSNDEEIKAALVLTTTTKYNYILFTTKKGYIKKTHISEYSGKRKMSKKAINLVEDDEIVDINFVNDDRIGILTNQGHFVMIDSSNINPIGRITRGIIGIKLNKDDYVIASHSIAENDEELFIATEDGNGLRRNLNDFRITNKGTKGVKIQKEEQKLSDFLTFKEKSDIMVISNKSRIIIDSNTVRMLKQGGIGVKLIKLHDKEKVIKILKFN